MYFIYQVSSFQYFHIKQKLHVDDVAAGGVLASIWSSSFGIDTAKVDPLR